MPENAEYYRNSGMSCGIMALIASKTVKNRSAQNAYAVSTGMIYGQFLQSGIKRFNRLLIKLHC